MAGVTDAAFRAHLVRYSRPDVLWTEFVSCDGLCHPQGREALLVDLRYTEAERPIVAQVFTAHPDKMREAAALIADLGFDGLDINMGCPDRNVTRQGAGATLMKDPALAQAIIRAAQAGVAGRIPVSVKTRLGFDTDELETWLPALLETRPAAITLHCRTKKEMSKVPARWERVRRAVEIARDSGTLILGNGDVKNIADARQRVAETGAAGVLLGRAVFGNPWLFDGTKEFVTAREKLEAALDLTETFSETFGDTKPIDLLKKHYRAYVAGFPEAKELRGRLMTAREPEEMTAIFEDALVHFPYLDATIGLY